MLNIWTCIGCEVARAMDRKANQMCMRAACVMLSLVTNLSALLDFGAAQQLTPAPTDLV